MRRRCRTPGRSLAGRLADCNRPPEYQAGREQPYAEGSAQSTARDACRRATHDVRLASLVRTPVRTPPQQIEKQAGDDFPRKILLLGGTASRPQLLPPVVISKDTDERLGQGITVLGGH